MSNYLLYNAKGMLAQEQLLHAKKTFLIQQYH